MSLADFYNSQDWRNLRLRLMTERTNRQDGALYCEFCHNPILKPYECIAHHKKELTESNYMDSSISLNPSNIMLVHNQCHQRIHKKFGAGIERKVYLVYGAPLSGKTSWVKARMQYGDIVLDMDNLWEAISGQRRFIRPEEIRPIVFSLRKELEEAIAMRRGQWTNAFVIGSYPNALDRKRACERFGAEEVFIDCPKDECLRRLENDPERQEVKDEWRKYIEGWFFEYSVYGGD